MKHRRLSVAAAALLLSLAIGSAAQTRPGSFLADPIDLARLTNKADLIITGRVDSIREAVATLSIDRVVKGEAAAQTIDFQFFPDRPSAYERIQPGLFGMFFLKRNEAGDGFQILDPTYPAVIAPPGAVLTNKRGLDRTVAILGQVLLTSRSAEDRRLALRVLSSAQTARATKLLRRGAKDNDVVVRMQSISALLNRNDLETLASAERTLLDPPAGTESYLLDNMSAALEGMKDPQAIPALQRLLRSANTRTRLGAVSALRQMHAMKAVEGLVIALGDNDRAVRYEGVIGLAELTGQDQWAPAIDQFAREEQRYLDHWKAWSRTK